MKPKCNLSNQLQFKMFANEVINTNDDSIREKSKPEFKR